MFNEKMQYKIMFRLILIMFIGSLSTCTTVTFGELLAYDPAEHLECVSLNNRP